MGKFKKCIKKILLRIISRIDHWELRGIELDQNDPSKKIIRSEYLNDVQVLSDSGYVQASEVHLTQPYDVWWLETENGFRLECADLHVVYNEKFERVFVDELKLGDFIQTENGPSRVVSVENTGIPVCMMDLSVEHQDHRFYANGVLGANTITSSIHLLWYLIFNSEKNAMILANIGDTAAELMDKIKTIMKKLPFFLKPGIDIFNVMTMKFDNGCRIMAKTTTKSSSIGFTVHFLYMDEFAHINPNYIGGFFKSVYPTIASSVVSRIIITSTPNGLNKFYDIYMDALAGKNSFNPIRVDWWQVPGRDEEWKRKEIANLGSEEDFNQEYGNQFLSSSRLLLDSYTLKRLKKSEVTFVHRELIPFQNSVIDYSELKWHPMFDPGGLGESDEQKRFVILVDTAAGGGGDFTVANIFKVSPLPMNLILEKKFYEDESDFFCLLQVGMFRSNTMKMDEFKPFMEILCTEVLDPDSIKIGIEVDFKGGELIDKLLNGDKVFDEMLIFTKHYESSKQMKAGIKMTPITKERYCEMLKSNCRAGRIIPTDRVGIAELGDFGENTKGNYSSQSGKDDIAMTCVLANSVFDYDDFEQMVQDIYDTIPMKYKELIEKKMGDINAKNGGSSKDSEGETWNVFKEFF